MDEGTPKETNRLEVWICDGHTPVCMLAPEHLLIDGAATDDCTVQVGFSLGQLRLLARAIKDHFKQLKEFEEHARLAAELEEEGASPELIDHLLP